MTKVKTILSTILIGRFVFILPSEAFRFWTVVEAIDGHSLEIELRTIDRRTAKKRFDHLVDNDVGRNRREVTSRVGYRFVDGPDNDSTLGNINFGQCWFPDPWLYSGSRNIERALFFQRAESSTRNA
jgi:hypothetical protein